MPRGNLIVDETISFSVSAHARRRMIQRGVNVSWVRRTLQHPDMIQPDREDPELTHAVKRFFRHGDSICLRVVYNHTKVPWRIVTVFFDRKSRKAK